RSWRKCHHKRKRQKVFEFRKTIVENVGLINGKFETTIEIDPLLHQLSSNFNVGNPGHLLMSNLYLNPVGTFLIDSNASLDFSTYEDIQTSPMSGSILDPSLLSYFSSQT